MEMINRLREIIYNTQTKSFEKFIVIPTLHEL